MDHNVMKRLPVIRHVRWLYLNWRLWRWVENVKHIFPTAPNYYDLVYLQKIWDGEA